MTILWQVDATDADAGVNGKVVYRLQDRAGANSSSPQNASAITIHPETGDLFLNSQLTLSEFTLFVEASDSPASESEKRTSLAIVVIRWELL